MYVLYMFWSVIAWALAFTAMLTVVLLCLPLTLLIPFERLQGGWPSRVVGALPRLTLSRFTVTRDPGFNPQKVCLYVMNHTSMLDGPIAVGALPHPFCGVENAAHLRVPGYGWLMTMANAIPVYPRNKGRTERLIASARERVGRGISVLAFPEAHRTMDGKVRPFRRGVFFMARAAGIPVVPVAVRGMYQVLPKGKLVVTPGHIDVYIGPQIPTDGVDDEGIGALAERCREIIVDYLDHGRTADN